MARTVVPPFLCRSSVFLRGGRSAGYVRKEYVGEGALPLFCQRCAAFFNRGFRSPGMSGRSARQGRGFAPFFVSVAPPFSIGASAPRVCRGGACRGRGFASFFVSVAPPFSFGASAPRVCREGARVREGALPLFFSFEKRKLQAGMAVLPISEQAAAPEGPRLAKTGGVAPVICPDCRRSFGRSAASVPG